MITSSWWLRLCSPALSRAATLADETEALDVIAVVVVDSLARLWIACCCCQRGLCCPLSHLLVVVANTLQLFMMVTFLCFLLAALNEPGALSWFAVFAPLWLSDVITLCTAMLELSRACRARPESFM